MSQGTLRISVMSDSMMLAATLPVEVRDGSLSLVTVLKGSGTVQVDPGLYSVSAVLEDGELHRETVQVKGGGEQVVRLSAAPPTGEPHFAFSPAPPPAAVYPLMGGPATPPELESVTGATVKSHSVGEWVFVPRNALQEVPVARIRTGDRAYTVSLPVNPESPYPLDSCTLRIAESGPGARLDVRLAPQRTVSSTIARMLESGFVQQTAALAGEARSLLIDKYRDPVGAALGGLLLHRFGRLKARQDWVENLARDFPWLPDGRILLASLLAGSESADDRVRGLELLLEAAPMRMMFTDGLSLAIGLLRRWPQAESQAGRRAEVLQEISRVAAGTQWHEIVLIVESTSP